MTHEQIGTLDPSGMYALLRGFPDQVRSAVDIGTAAPFRLRRAGVRSIVLCGLGGSAIGGDLLKSYLADELEVPFMVNRHYTLPAFVGPDTLVILASYSGNTEETNAAHAEALRRKARILCISSNGTTERLALRRTSPFLKIPGGLPPRAALGYSFFPLLLTLQRAGFIKDRTKDIQETIALLDQLAADYARPDAPANRALDLAGQLAGRIGVIYSSTERFDAVNTRWRGQIAENGKSLAFGHVLPEMNHNELVGWKVLKDQMRDIQVVFLRDRGDHARIAVRMDITKTLLTQHTPRVVEVWSEGRSVLARLFSLVHLGDWVSFYLAMLHNEDPTPVDVIGYLKTELAKV
jgi:glucose/mannose-6-phosphate isomerase